MSTMKILVQTDDFDVAHELKELRIGKPAIGAVALFVGLVRDINDGQAVGGMTLEHYPGMTEKSLEAIAREAQSRWRLEHVTVIHRVGQLFPEDQIVLVAVASSHRPNAFAACEFVMDYLKTSAPFWKKESTSNGDRWVEARETDEARLKKWIKD